MQAKSCVHRDRHLQSVAKCGLCGFPLSEPPTKRPILSHSSPSLADEHSTIVYYPDYIRITGQCKCLFRKCLRVDGRAECRHSLVRHAPLVILAASWFGKVQWLLCISRLTIPHRIIAQSRTQHQLHLPCCSQFDTLISYEPTRLASSFKA